MFPEIPADLSSLSDEELAALLGECQAAYAAARTAASTTEDVAALSSYATSMASLVAETGTRAEAANAGGETPAEVAEALAALDTQFAADGTPIGETGTTGTEGEGDAGGTEGEGAEGDEGNEPVTAADIAELVTTAVDTAMAARTPALPRRSAVRASIAELASRRIAEQAPLPAPTAEPFTITAAADIPGVGLGQPLDQRQLAQAMIDRWQNLGSGRGGPDDKVPVASFAIQRGPERTLSSEDMEWANDRKVRDAAEAREAVVAAGGLCAPTEGYYERRVISEAWRPVMDGPITRFTADRGGIRFNPPAALGDITSGFGTVTAAQDLAGGAPAAKSCFAVTCSSVVEAVIEADYVCMQFGNFGAMTYPEDVVMWMALAAAAHARAAETNRLTDIKAASIQDTAAGLVGASREILNRIEQQQAVINSAARRPNDAPVEAILPQWVLALMRADIRRTLGDLENLSVTDQEIGAMFAASHILVTLTPDSATGNGQVIAQEAGGVINEYPSHVFAEVFVPGTILGLDGGRLDLGLVRDSALTMGSATAPTTPGNQFRMFYENFEALAFIGPAGSRVELDMTVCADGTYGAAKAVTCPIVT